MQAISSSSPAPSKTNRFPSKTDLIRRVMHEFELYHQFEFEQEIAENEEMKYEDLDDLFKTGRAFKAKISSLVDSTMFEDEGKGNNIYADDHSSDSEDADNPAPAPKKKAGAYSTWFITLDLDNQLNRRYTALHEMEEIAPAAKEKSALHFMIRSRDFSSKTGLYENQTVVAHATILKRTGSEMEIVVTDTKQNVNKMIKLLEDSDEWDEGCFFACYNDMTTRKRVRELNQLMVELLEKRILMGQVLDFLVGKPPMPVENLRYDQNLVEPQIRNLNPSQQESIRNYLTCESFYLTIGPPGTGKSEVICKFLELCHQMNLRVLVCSMSHAAVDNVLLRFARSPYYQEWRNNDRRKCNIIRYGKPYFIDPASKPYQKYMSETSAVELFKYFKIHFSTLTASFSRTMRNYVETSGKDFDYILVDEAAMCVDPFIFMAMSLGKKMILAGDHFQLKPIVKHEVVQKTSLTKSLFEKLVSAANLMRSGQAVQVHASRVYNLLTIQYRMNNLISSPSSRYFYESKVTTHPPIANIDLNGLNVKPGKILSRKTPIVWVDHNGYESEGSMNETEAMIIARLVEDAIYMGVRPSEIGVISAYRAQIFVINKALEQKNVLYPKEEMLVGTIDAFQGGEREVVIVATTRSNKGQCIGFLRSEERMNVALTRAKRLCVFVGSASTLIKKDASFIKEYYEFTRTHGEVLWYDRFKKTFKKANTSTQMSKPAVPGPKIAISGTTSGSAPSHSRNTNSLQLPQHQPSHHYENTSGTGQVIAAWQPEPVPAQYNVIRQPAASFLSGTSAHSALEPNWQASAWEFQPGSSLHITNNPDQRSNPMWTYPSSRSDGSGMSIPAHRLEAPGMYPLTWGSSSSMQPSTTIYQPSQHQYERSKEPISEFSGVPSTSSHHHQRPPAEVPKSNGNKLPVASKTPTDLKMSSGPGPRPTRAPVKKGPIQLMANPYAPPTAGWIPTAETGWDWHYEGRSATAFPAA